MKNNNITRIGKKEFRWGERTYVMGIINLSPDSFSGDGLAGADAALAQAERFEAEGADILDIGGESTRPGSSPITVEEEIKRVMPVIERLAAKVSVPISVDTYKIEAARTAVQAGANILNDQWGLRHGDSLARLASEHRIPIILMNNRRESDYTDVMAEVVSGLKTGLKTALEAGVPPENIILDPGIGFGKRWQENLEIIRRLREIKDLGQPVLVGPSRKSFIDRVLHLPPDERVEGTAAAVAISIANGADIVRVHDVRAMVRVVRIADAVTRPGASG